MSKADNRNSFAIKCDRIDGVSALFYKRDKRSRYGSESWESSHHRREYKDYGNKRSRYESSRKAPGRSDWEYGRWEWEDTPRRDSSSNGSRLFHPSPSPMLAGASPDARLVSPWLGSDTPQSGLGASPWIVWLLHQFQLGHLDHLDHQLQDLAEGLKFNNHFLHRLHYPLRVKKLRRKSLLIQT